jgi:hypothetical protein
MPVMRRRIAALLVVAIGVIHLILVPEYLDEQPYVGILFILTGLGAAVVAPRLWFRGGTLAWALGALIAVCTFAGFVVSRTIGLPGFKESDWEPLGIASLIVEGCLLALFVHRERRAIVAMVPTSDDRDSIHTVGAR